MAKFYIASKLENEHDVNAFANRLIANGHEITYNWAAPGSVKESLARLEEVGEAEMNGVLDADVVIGLLPGGRGTHVEIGMALAWKKLVILVSPDETPFVLGDQTSAFYHVKNALKFIGGLYEAEEFVLSALCVREAVLRTSRAED